MSQTTSESNRGLLGTVLAVLFIIILIWSSYSVLHPFLPALVWATMIVVSTWPLLLLLEGRLKGRRALAVTLMVLGLFVTLIIPLTLAINTIVDNTEVIGEWIQTASNFERPSPPEWLDDVPLVGPKLVTRWKSLAASNRDDLIARATPYVGKLVSWFIEQIGQMGLLLIHFLLTLVLSAVLYMNGEVVAAGVLSFADRLAGTRGVQSARLAGAAIRAVALGIIGTALVQSIIAGLGFVIVGVPQAVLLTAVTFFFSIIQIGAVPVMIPVVIWLFWGGMSGWGVFMVVWTLIVGVLDNVMRPLLIKRGANLPLLLVFAGVIGGLIEFGVIGLFVGPVVLAVSYTLLRAWVTAAPDDLRAS